MQHSIPLYYDDPYTQHFKAVLLDCQEDARGYWLLLDKTLFFPGGGGQPADKGILAGQKILDVQKDDEGRILHLIAKRPTTPHLEGHIDWPHRYHYMCAHSAQHLASAVFAAHHYATLSVHFGRQYSSIEIDSSAITDTEFAEIEDNCAQYVRSALPILCYMSTPQESELRRPLKVTQHVRIVEISSLDKVGCGGLHLRSTAEIGPMKIIKIEKIRGNFRSYWVQGSTAQEDYRNKHNWLMRLSTLLSTKPETVALSVKKLLDTQKTQEHKLRHLQQQYAHTLFTREQDEVIRITDTWLFSHYVDCASQYSRPRAILLENDDTFLWALIFPFTPPTQWLREILLPSIHGKGGGRKGIWRGSATHRDGVPTFISLFHNFCQSPSSNIDKGDIQ